MQIDVASALRQLSTRIDALSATPVLVPVESELEAVRRAVEVRDAADHLVRAVVSSARENGSTWQQIGGVLGITRQAAFQRYGKVLDPRTGEPMETSPLPSAKGIAAAIVDELSVGNWSAVADRFDEMMRANLPEEALAAAWAQILGLAGAFESRDEPTAVRAADFTITNTTVHLEAADYTARITLRDDATIAGIHLLQEDETT